jgi:hypothetical protein
VHRDVKPSNLLVLEDRGDSTYLVDFGIAHAVGAGTLGGTALTASGSTVGTLAYMAPERFTAEQSVDGRADVYSLACVLFEMLTSEHPFPFEGAPALLNAHLNMAPPRVTERRPDLSPAWDRVVGRGMAKDPEERYPTAGELAADARTALTTQNEQEAPTAPATPAVDPTGPVRFPATGGTGTHQQGHGPGAPPQARRPRRRTVLLVVAGLVAVAAVVAAVVFSGAGQTSDAPPPAPLSAPDGSAQPTYVTYRDAGGRFSVDVPSVLTGTQPIADGVRLSTPNGSVTVDVTAVRDPAPGSPQTALADRTAAFENAGGTVTRTGSRLDSYTLSGTDRSGNTVAVRSRVTAGTVGAVTWTYPPSEEGRWSGFVDRSGNSLTVG